jgi:GNAT superfamily N-acetyltransferase
MESSPVIDQPTASPRVEIRWHTGARDEIRPLFALAEDSPEQLKTYLHLGRVLVALEEGSIVGHLQLVDSDTPGEVELKSMAVLHQRQRRGIGRAMVERALAESRADGARMMLVATATADTGNLRFYQLQGFRMLSIERDAFTTSGGYQEGLTIDGIPLRDRVWLTRPL